MGVFGCGVADEMMRVSARCGLKPPSSHPPLSMVLFSVLWESALRLEMFLQPYPCPLSLLLPLLFPHPFPLSFPSPSPSPFPAPTPHSPPGTS